MDGRQKREFVLRAMLREIGLDRKFFTRWLRRKDPLPRETLRVMGRFIEDWEAGMLEFRRATKSDGLHANRMLLVHRKTPKPIPARLTIDFSGRGPRLKLIAKPRRDRMPTMPEISGKLTGK
jgi:hypothetical protein